ncbi:MAG TPA: hypothetical protein VMF13_16130 [Luteitalea sp.]|nr:hypothetical protein [Luteitalea sp.]
MDSMRVIAVTALVLFVAALPANCEERQPARAGRPDVRAAVAAPR